MAEFMNVITMSAVMVTFSEVQADTIRALALLGFGVLWFVGKVFIFVSVFVWMRGTLLDHVTTN